MEVNRQFAGTSTHTYLEGATWVQDIFDVSLAGPHCPDWAGCDEVGFRVLLEMSWCSCGMCLQHSPYLLQKDFLMPQPSICADGGGTVYGLNGHSDIMYVSRSCAGSCC
jgi:hypothetical protein